MGTQHSAEASLPLPRSGAIEHRHFPPSTEDAYNNSRPSLPMVSGVAGGGGGASQVDNDLIHSPPPNNTLGGGAITQGFMEHGTRRLSLLRL